MLFEGQKSEDTVPASIIDITKEIQTSDDEQNILLGGRSPFITILDLAYKQLLSFLITSVTLFLTPFMITKAIPNNEAALGALAVAAPFEYLSQMFGWFIAVGGSATISYLVGQNNIEGAKLVLVQLIALSFIIAILLAVILLPSLKSLLLLLIDATQGQLVLSLCYSYIVPFISGAIFVMLFFCVLAVFMGTGQMTMYMILSAGQQILYICILCPCFLFLTNLGIAGASLAFILSFIPSIIVGVIFLQKKGEINFDFKLLFKIRTFQYLKKVAGVGGIDLIASASGIIVLGTIQTLITKIALRYAEQVPDNEKKSIYEQVLAAWGCLSKIYGVVVGLCYNTTGSYLTAASYAIGAKRYARFYQLTVLICVITCVFILIITLIVLGIAPYIAVIFSKLEFYVDLSTTIIRIFCITGLILPLQFIVTTFCQAADYIVLGLIVAFITQILLLPVLFITIYFSTKSLPVELNFIISMTSFNINDVISGIISVIVMCISLKKFTGKHNITMTLKLAFAKTDLVDSLELNETEISTSQY
ncbi:MATE efflux family protein [Spironucleus salmonicida]|uniref:MATE efflux family protein n=1 Tax=Spironucleus salmonicida TaxID=348837 RepID=V6LG55_9EUKA|nr:MATE efflux family protein [Spironucleus salmonicida]|eukprot:EST43540.1 Multi antimicrobial extrusion (MATE) family protein [Spironucleus salmonicida]